MSNTFKIVVSYHDGASESYKCASSDPVDLAGIISDSVAGWAVLPTDGGTLTVHLGGVRSIETITE